MQVASREENQQLAAPAIAAVATVFCHFRTYYKLNMVSNMPNTWHKTILQLIPNHPKSRNKPNFHIHTNSTIHPQRGRFHTPNKQSHSLTPQTLAQGGISYKIPQIHSSVLGSHTIIYLSELITYLYHILCS